MCVYIYTCMLIYTQTYINVYTYKRTWRLWWTQNGASKPAPKINKLHPPFRSLCVCVCVCVCVCMRGYLYIHRCMYACMSVWIYTEFVRFRLTQHAIVQGLEISFWCVYICRYTSACGWVVVGVYTHTHANTHTLYIPSVCVCVCVPNSRDLVIVTTCSRLWICFFVCVYVYMYVYMYVCMYVCRYIYLHTYTEFARFRSM